jgi:hypothetical protein
VYSGPPIDDPSTLERLPPAYRHLLERVNGYVAYHGGLHVRGACLEPAWHSLREAWFGPEAMHALYPEVRADDIPFGEDALGDQFLIRAGEVLRLVAETGEVKALGVDLVEFDERVRADPTGYLSLEPLEAFRADGGVLHPGKLLSVHPPFVFEAGGERSYRATDAHQHRRWMADLAGQLRDLPDGAQVRFRAVP